MSDDLVVSETAGGITVVRMNDPRRLNGWTKPMLAQLRSAFASAASSPETKVLVLTGTGRYYCAGVNLGAAVELGHPRALHEMIVETNRGLFELFIDFPKPILVAANGPAIGASVTSAALCDGIVAAESATFSTPFAALGVPAEGCSSVMFPRRFGATAERMLGPEGWKPTAAEAEAMGLVQWVVPDDELMDKAREIAREWIEAGRERTFPGGATIEELREINARESVQVADGFLAPPFLMGQARFLWGKKKRRLALVFLGLRLTHPAWSRLL